MVKIAKDIALEHCSADIRAKAIEVAAQGSIPDDDPLWLVFLATAETRSIPTLVDKLAVIEEAMGLLTTALLENDQTIAALKSEVTQCAQPQASPTQQGFPLSRWPWVCAVLVGGLVLLGGGLLFAILRPSAPVTNNAGLVKPVDTVNEQSEEPLVLPLTQLKSHLSLVNQNRLEHCLIDANDKCTLLINEPEPADGSEELDSLD